ncbi:MAG: hypothetical protein V3V33_16570 [Candidatus Lokiarchaeia archaeon]
MKIELDIEELKKLGLSPNNYIFLFIINKKGMKEAFEMCGDDLSNLEEKGYIKIIPDKIILRNKALELFNTTEDNDFKVIKLGSRKVKVTNDIIELVGEYRSLFPKNILSGGYPVKGNQAACFVRMQEFKNSNPQVTNEQILKAARTYVNERRMNNYAYMKTANYFIYKDSESMLLSYIENIDDMEETSDNGTNESSI